MAHPDTATTSLKNESLSHISSTTGSEQVTALAKIEESKASILSQLNQKNAEPSAKENVHDAQAVAFQAIAHGGGKAQDAIQAIHNGDKPRDEKKDAYEAIDKVHNRNMDAVVEVAKVIGKAAVGIAAFGVGAAIAMKFGGDQE